ncbi:hypothetical protein ACHQM5_029509 [Ranunculus cassubicifolius]
MDKIDLEEKMEISSTQEETIPLATRRKGGLLTMPFIIANESFEKVASYGILPNMIFYLLRGYNMSAADGSSLLQLWSAFSNFTPLFGAFLSDSYLGRFLTIALGSVFSLLGMTVLWLTAMIPSAKPPPGQNPNTAQKLMLYGSFILMSLGAGGIRPCSIAFGADQLIRKGNPNNKRILQSYFSFYYASIGISTVIALTIIVYIQDHKGWRVGFGIPAILMLLSVLAFYIGYPLYLRVNADTSLFTGLGQVMVVAFRNKSLAHPADGNYHIGKETSIVTPSRHLRFLNKASIIRNPQNDVNPDGSAVNPWKLCTIEQVEALKSLIRIIPIWSTGIIIFMSVTGGTLTVLQASTMDRHMSSSFQIPAGSFAVFTVITVTIWVAFYDQVVVPLMAKYTSHKRGFSSVMRIGMGLVLSILGMAVSAWVEIIRRRRAIREGLADNPRGVVEMSAFWLVPQFVIGGLAEGLNAVGQIEFYYSQLPKNMASLAMGLFSLNNAFAGLLGSFLVKTVDRITRRGGKTSWVDSNPNKGHYHYYYWFLAILSAANLVYFLLCCWTYGPLEEVKPRDSDEKEVLKEGESSIYKELPSSSTTS